MKFMVIETFRAGAKEAVYERYASQGRMLPDGLAYIDSWLTTDGNRCFQLMETDDEALFDTWTREWRDLVHFEVIPVQDSPTKKAS